MAKKFEKIILTTAIETYRDSDHPDAESMSALDELIPIIEKYASEVTVVDYEHGGDFTLTTIESEATNG